ncbi:YybH family protein [Nocardioides sp. JS614]|uniref:YybH family protein n=1 Tax=Nocardioides sp. (strain ATCC BAA-499 / JS614) TaxID=196162 RepID=UPI0009FC968E|nr:nuclear transport factor 2 family protein [Nocardioides sp. JS614]
MEGDVLSGNTPLAAAEGMLRGVIDRDLDAVLDSFTSAADAYMYVEGPRWTTRGGDNVAQGWRAYFDTGIGIDSFSWVEGPQVIETPALSAVLGVVDYQVRSAEGSQPAEHAPLRLRMTWLLRPEDGRWRIVHEHGSQPLVDPYGSGDWWPEGATPLPTAGS